MANAATNFNRQFQSNSLQAIYDQYISSTSAIGIDRIDRIAFEKKIDSELEIIKRKVSDGTYNFSQYREKLISKGAGKYPRVISIPTFRDRIVLRGLCNVLRDTFADDLEQKIPQHVIAGIKIELSAAKFSHFIKIDISNFYPSIDHKILESTVKRRIRKPQLFTLIQKAISSPTVAFPDKAIESAARGVPQGLAISNILAEIYLKKFDAMVSSLSDIAYFRYVDDVLVLCNSNPEDLFENIRSEFEKKFNLTVHPLGEKSKSRVADIDESFSFLGYLFSDGKAEIKKDSILRIEGALAKIFTTFKYKNSQIESNYQGLQKDLKLKKSRAIFLWRLNLRITGCIFDGARKGWVFYFSQIDESNIRQLRKLDITVSTIAARFGVTFSGNDRKSFLRTFFETQKHNNISQKYIPNFDTVDETEQRRILAEYFGVENVNGFTSDQVIRSFKSRIQRATRELEHDIQDIS